jgi:purine-binding chemotaxis protein CheW
MTQLQDNHSDLETTDDERAGKYLTFDLGEEEYGIPIIKVKEINGMMSITPVPQTDEFIKGVINLRGKVIPVIDLRLKFGMEAVEYTERSCIIVVEVLGENGTVPIGLIVDAVSEVNNIGTEEVEDSPTFGASLSTEYILGMAKKEDGVKILLDINKVLAAQELSRVCETGDTAGR